MRQLRGVFGLDRAIDIADDLASEFAAWRLGQVTRLGGMRRSEAQTCRSTSECSASLGIRTWTLRRMHQDPSVSGTPGPEETETVRKPRHHPSRSVLGGCRRWVRWVRCTVARRQATALESRMSSRSACSLVTALLVLTMSVPAFGGQKISPPTGSTFGGLAADGDVVVSTGDSVKVYRRTGGVYAEEQVWALPNADVPVVNGPVIAVGQEGDDDQGSGAGAVSIYRFDGTAWLFEQKIYASDPQAGAGFGSALVLDGSELHVGALGYSGAPGPGVVYVFRFNGTSWVEEQRIGASDETPGVANWFSGQIARRGDVVAVSAKDAVYALRWNGTIWVEEEKISAPDSAAVVPSIAMMPDTILVRDRSAKEIEVFRWDAFSWVEKTRLPFLGYEGGSAGIGSTLTTFGNVLLTKIGRLGGLYGWTGSEWVYGPVLFAPEYSIWSVAQITATDGHLVLTATDKVTRYAMYAYPFRFTCDSDCHFNFPIDIAKLRLVRKPSGKETLKIAVHDKYLPFPSDWFYGPFADFSEGATLELFSQAEGTASHPIPAGPAWGWGLTFTNVIGLYKNKDAPLGPSSLKKLSWKTGKIKTLKLAGKALGLPMATPHGEIAVRLTAGALRVCALFDASSLKRDLPGSVVGKGAVASSLPDCADASMP